MKPRKSGSSFLRTASGSGRTQNKDRSVRISGPELVRAIAAKIRQGAPYGNENAKKTLEWLDSYDLSTPAGLDAFMQEVVRQVWTGELGTRAASSINGTLRLLLEHMTLPALEKRIELLEQGVRG